MIKLFPILLFMLLLSICSKATDTLHVITHNKLTVVTDPSKGENHYTQWGVFPSVKTSVRKIVLHVRFTCPDSMRCADWDYLDFISIRKVGGSGGADKNFEIARMLTPYGGAFNRDWKFDWEVDITDFSLLLRDSVQIDYNHTGWEPNKDRGWAITLDFEIIKGKPIAEPVSIQQIYSGAYVYGDSAVSIEEKLSPVHFRKTKGAYFAKLRINQTGHGANEGDDCGEFCSKYRDIIFNGQQIDRRNIWKKCGDNPLYPQAGTWLFDRANWCPGYLQQPDEYLLPLANENTVDINMEPYQVKKTEAVENISAYIIQYKKSPFQNDVSIIDIINPGSKDSYLRTNPVCSNPTIIIKNNGTRPLSSVLIKYGSDGFPQKSYVWKGNLAPGNSTTIILPGQIESAAQKNYFIVSLLKPNGKADGFPTDNSMGSLFMQTPVHGRKLFLLFKTNKQPSDNFYTLTDASGKMIYRRNFAMVDSNKLFKDSFLLEPGCYQLHISDTAGNGLEFWANNLGGRGYTLLLDEKGNIAKQFESDFGSNLYYNFMVSSDTAAWSKVNLEPAIGLYPTRTKGKTILDYYNGQAKDITVQIITDEGNHLVEEHQYKNIKQAVFTYDLSYRPAQRYYLKVFIDKKQIFNKRIRVVD